MDEKTINLLCEKFHTTVDNLIPVYSHYMIGKDIATIIISIILIIISIITFYLCHKRGKRIYGDAYNLMDWGLGEMFLYFGCIIVILVGFIEIFCSIYDYALWIHCPEMRFLDTVMHSTN